MARPKKLLTTKSKPKSSRGRPAASQRVSKASSTTRLSVLERVQQELNLKQSYLSLFLGVLIVAVAGLLVFNYFKKPASDLGPAQSTSEQAQAVDVNPDSLPGKYTVKEGDTLFTIADHYYKDGYKFAKIAEANQVSNVNMLTVGQVLEIPKLEESQAQQASAAPSASPDTSLTAQNIGPVTGGTGGATNETIWGEKITTNTYTVQEGDWLSKIAGRAYGDIMAFDKIAKANNIPNPDLITPGMVLNIPR